MGGCCNNYKGSSILSYELEDEMEKQVDPQKNAMAESTSVADRENTEEQIDLVKSDADCMNTKSESSEDIFEREVKKIKLGNDITREVYAKHGHYSYKQLPSDEAKRILLPLRPIKNVGQYYGFWNEHASKRDGNGVMIDSNGSRYDGTWKNDKMDGYGRLIHAEGSVYVGEWKNGKANGRGILIQQDGVKYEGEWVNDIKEGKGAEIVPGVMTYEGQYKNGVKEGKGKLFFQTGKAMPENLCIMPIAEKEYTRGKMGVATMVNGLMTECMAMVY
eukprot:TRINITY_DN5027_c0_g2_i5.p1 TRINITY_DN5027_c0_g2~~TRINITY_DN5027_c0_g2_i5.p1  ORF type:complete len:275 (+),score=42.45 TRINITY_DN5027_c0_g2_i5:46-870(+)